MIDLHSHILPQVDDGAGSLEESMRMIAIAYKDGIRQIVATPHRNHPVDFKYKGNIEEAFQLLSTAVKEKYPDIHLYIGAELFVRKGFSDVLDNRPYDFTINHSRYVLIEFDVSASFLFMQDAIHELKVRGFLPILAHVEYYKELFDNPARLRTLKDEGVAIQITSSNLTGKNGKNMQTFVKQLVSMGMVDIVSSDAHKSNFRRPLLKDAYDLTVQLTNEMEAKRIFIENQQAIITDGSINESKIMLGNLDRHDNRSRYRNSVLVAVVVLVAIIFITTSGWINSRNGGAVKSPTTVGSSEVSQEETVVPTEVNRETIKIITIPEKTNIYTTEQSTVVATNPSKDAIEKIYLEKLLIYQQEYEAELDRMVGLIIEARENIADDKARKSVVEEYLNDIINLEEQADVRVYQALYELQNELEAYQCGLPR